MSTRFSLAIIVLALLVFSCEKEEQTTPQTNSPTLPEASAYWPMEIGNYWIYEIFEIDTNGRETPTGRMDSLYISGTETINGTLYYHFEGDVHLCLPDYLRDSSGYLTSSYGNVLFAPNDFSDTLGVDLQMLNETDTLYVGYSNMEKPSGKINLKAGSFEALLCRSKFHIHASGALLKHRELLEYRPPGVGVIKKQCASTINPITYEGRLVRYSVQ